MQNTSTHQGNGHVCSVIPPFLLTDILTHDGFSPATKFAVTKTLNHLGRLQERRQLRRAQNFLTLTEGSSTEGGKVTDEEISYIAADDEAGSDPPVAPVENAPKAPVDEPVPSPKKTVNRQIFDSKKTNKLRKVLVYQEGDDTAHLGNDVNLKEVHDYFGKSYGFLSEVFGRDSIDGAGFPLRASIHFDDVPGEPGMDNAFWDGDEMAFGDGDGEIFGSFTKNIDVIGHELTHGLIQFLPALEYEFQSGALNESLADVFGIMIKQYYHPNGKQLASDSDWLIGEGIFMPTLANAKALRSMKAPGTAYNNPKIGKDRQPADMSKYAKLPKTSSGDWGGVHINSGIPNRAFYLVATELGGYSWDKAGRIWYAAMSDPALQGVDTKNAFVIFANLTLKYASELFDQNVEYVVRKAWTTVKLFKAVGIDGDHVNRAML